LKLFTSARDLFVQSTKREVPKTWEMPTNIPKGKKLEQDTESYLSQFEPVAQQCNIALTEVQGWLTECYKDIEGELEEYLESRAPSTVGSTQVVTYQEEQQHKFAVSKFAFAQDALVQQCQELLKENIRQNDLQVLLQQVEEATTLTKLKEFDVKLDELVQDIALRKEFNSTVLPDAKGIESPFLQKLQAAHKLCQESLTRVNFEAFRKLLAQAPRELVLLEKAVNEDYTKLGGEGRISLKNSEDIKSYCTLRDAQKELEQFYQKSLGQLSSLLAHECAEVQRECAEIRKLPHTAENRVALTQRVEAVLALAEKYDATKKHLAQIPQLKTSLDAAGKALKEQGFTAYEQALKGAAVEIAQIK
ncbi:MAG: hypothetical protein ACRDF4_07505, partial [Rhabdochlamydiaceae bacterium]